MQFTLTYWRQIFFIKSADCTWDLKLDVKSNFGRECEGPYRREIHKNNAGACHSIVIDES